MLIGIAGRIGSGKDTLADLLSMALYEKLHKFGPSEGDLKDYHVTGKMVRSALHIEIHKFADALKDIVVILTGCTRSNLEDREFKESFLPSEWWHTISDARMWLVITSSIEHNVIYSATEEEVRAWAIQRGYRFERTYRELLQELGTNVLRTYHPDIHVNATFSKYKELPTEGEHWHGHAITMPGPPNRYPDWIITDVRFPNEAAAIKQRGGIVIRINRYPTILHRSHVGEDGMVVVREIVFDKANPMHMDLWKGEMLRAHPSETSMDNYDGYDIVVDNDGTIEDLYKQAANIVKQFNLK